MSELAIEAFERTYAARSGTTVANLHAAGRFGAPCDCDEPECEGFQMLHLRDALIESGWVPPWTPKDPASMTDDYLHARRNLRYLSPPDPF